LVSDDGAANTPEARPRRKYQTRKKAFNIVLEFFTERDYLSLRRAFARAYSVDNFVQSISRPQWAVHIRKKD
jgi:hypothetical protein